MTNQNNNLPQAGFIRLPALLEIFPVGKSTLWNWIKEGKFPKPIKLSPRVSVWDIEQIKEIIKQHQSQSEKQC